MPDKKLTDSEIVKALECCCKGQLYQCNNCPLKINGYSHCFDTLRKYTLDLINRLQAENERLKNCWKADVVRGIITGAKAEAYKEFAERLKQLKYQSSDWSHGEHPFVVEESDIDDTLYELVGEDNVD